MLSTPTSQRLRCIDTSSNGWAKGDIERVAFIRRAQRLDLTLDEIGEILALRERGQRPCGYVRDIAHARLDELDRRIADMQRARDELHDLLQRADDLPDENCYCQLVRHRTNAQT